MNIDDTVCHCFHVTARKLLNWARLHGPRVASQLSDCGGAGTGCGWCVPFLKLIFQRARAGTSGQPDEVCPTESAAFDRLTAAEYAELRAAYVRSKPSRCERPAVSEAPPAEE
jgi:bacterioferritin-associated ferredoxin